MAETRTVPRLLVGSCPDSWGVWFAQDPLQTPWQRFLDEIVQAGYEWLELGPHGYLPTDPGQLSDELGRRGLRVSGQTAYAPLQDAGHWATTLADARRVAELVRAVGGRYVVALPGFYRDERTGTAVLPRQLDDRGWATLVRAADELGKILRSDYDLTLVVHPHADTHVETQQQTERLLDDTDPQHVALCLDTGHLAYRRADSAALIARYPERIGYVHIKQIDPAVRDVVERDDLPLGEAVKRGIMVEPPGGEPKIKSIFEALRRLDRRDLFVIVEQDLYPCDPGVPLPIAKRTRAYLRTCEIGA